MALRVREILDAAAVARRLDVFAVEAVEFGVQVLGQQALSAG